MIASVLLSTPLGLAALQDEPRDPAAELRAALAARPSDAAIRANRDCKAAVVGAPDPDTVVHVADATFFAALDPAHPGMDVVLADVEAGRPQRAWELLDRYLRERWRARADVRQVVNYGATLDDSERGRVDPDADDLARGIVVARGVRFDVGEPGGWADAGPGSNSFAGLHYWEWGRTLWESYVRTGREEDAATFDRLFRSWYAAREEVSAVFDYDAVWYELGLAHRPMQLARLLFAMRGSPALPLETRKLVLKTLLGSAHQLQAEQACGYTSGNFQMYACNSLYQLGLCLPMFRDARLWRETGKRRLVEHVFWDFTDDGGHSERAASYGQGTLRHVQRLILHARDDPDPGPAVEVIRDRVRTMELWFLAYATPTGELPGVNDSGFTDGAGWLQNLAWYAQDGRFLWPIRDRTSGVEGLEPVRPDFGSTHLPHDGWTILRDGWDAESFYFLVNWGRWGSSHTHDALLDVNAYAYGRPMVVEAGHFGGYDHPLDPWFRSPEAHNQVVLRDRELARRSQDGRVVRWRSGEAFDFFEAYHDGYRAACGRRLRRQVLFVKGEYWLVIDTLERRDREVRDTPEAALLWHAPHPWRETERGLVAGADGGPGVQLLCWPALEPSFATGYEAEAQELYGSRYRVALEQPAVPGARYVTVLSPFESEPPAASLDVVETPDGLVLAIRRGTTVDHALLRTAGGEDGVGEALRSDGAFAWLREDPRRAVVIDGSRLSWRDGVVLESAEREEILEGSG